MHSSSFVVCVGSCVHAQKCARSSTHECTRQKDASHAQSALDQRQTHADHTLGIRCMFVGEHLKPAIGRPYVPAFSLFGTVPAFTCDCLRFVCVFTRRRKLDLCVSTSSRTLLAFENNVSCSSSECSTPAFCRKVRPVAGSTHAERTPSVLLAHVQRTCNEYGRAVRWLSAERALHALRMGAACALNARAIRSARQQHAVHSLDYLPYALCMRSTCALYTSSTLATRCRPTCVVNSLASPKV